MTDQLWAVKSPTGTILFSTIAVTAPGAWQLLAGGNHHGKEQQIVADIGRGFDCVKVRVVEEKTE